MKKSFIEQMKEKLEERKKSLEKELKSFAQKSEVSQKDWQTLYPHFDGGNIGEEANEVEEYESLLPIEYTLELRLKDVNLALEKINLSTKLEVNTERSQSIKKDKYGICEKCGRKISKERLKIFPEARTCSKCK